MTIVLSIVVCCFVFHCVAFALFLFSSSMLFLLFPLPTLVLIRLTNLSSLCQCLQFTHVAVIPLIGASSDAINKLWVMRACKRIEGLQAVQEHNDNNLANAQVGTNLYLFTYARMQ